MSGYSQSPNVLTASLGGRSVLLNLRSHRCFGLNATAAVIWEGLERGESADGLVDGLCDRFQVSRTAAAESIEAFLEQLESRELIRSK